MLLHLVVGEYSNSTFLKREFRLNTETLFCIYLIIYIRIIAVAFVDAVVYAKKLLACFIRLIARGTHPSHEKLSTLFYHWSADGTAFSCGIV